MANLGTDGANLIKSHEGFSYRDPYGYPTGNPNDSLLTQAQADALSKSLNPGYTSPISQS